MSVWFEKVGVTGSSTRGDAKKVSFRSNLSTGYQIATITLTEGNVSTDTAMYSPLRDISADYLSGIYVGSMRLNPNIENAVSVYTPEVKTMFVPDWSNPTDITELAFSDDGYTTNRVGYIQFADHLNSGVIYPNGYEISGTINGIPVYDTRFETTELPDILDSVNDYSINQIIIPVGIHNVIKVGYVNDPYSVDDNFKVTYYPFRSVLS